MDSKYIFVNISIPFEAKNGSYDVILERMLLDIKPCKKLPAINTSENDWKLFKQIFLIQKGSEGGLEGSGSSENSEGSSSEGSSSEGSEKPIFVFDTKIAQGKTRQNITIRNISNKSTHFTRKKYESDLNSDKVVGSVPQLTVLEES